MRNWTRWQDWANLVLGLYLFVSPWMLGIAAGEGIAILSRILGISTFVAAVWALANPLNELPRWVAYGLGVLALSLPSALGLWTAVTGSWSAGLAGLGVVAMSSWALVSLNRCTGSHALSEEGDGDPAPRGSVAGNRLASGRSAR